MYYHALQMKGIQVLEPRISNHRIPLIYFSKKRENTLVYLSNGVHKYCSENKFFYEGSWMKWGPYGFDKEGKLQYEEYYPNALVDTYKGVSGYIYTCKEINKLDFELNIPNAYVSDTPTTVSGCEYIEDAYDEILRAERKKLISIIRYEEFITKRKSWLERCIRQQYEEANEHPEYRFFLKHKFKDILEG